MSHDCLLGKIIYIYSIAAYDLTFLMKKRSIFPSFLIKIRPGPRISRIRMPIRTKITVPYFFLAVLLAIGAGFLVTNVVFDTLDKRFQNQLSEVGQLSSELMVKEEDRLLESLRLLANTDGIAAVIIKGNPEELRKIIFGVAVNNQIDAVEILDNVGNPVFSMRHISGSVAEDYNFSAGGDGSVYRSWGFVDKVILNQSDPLGDKYSGYVEADWGNYFYVSGPVFDDMGKFTGVILVGTQAQTLVNSLRAKTLAQITLYDFDGKPRVTTFAFMPDALNKDTAVSVIVKQNLPESQVRVVKEQREVSVVDLDYTEVLAPWEVRGDADIGLLGAALQKNFFVNPSNLTSVQLGLLVALALFLVIMIGVNLADLITRPLLGLVKASQAVAEGDLDVKVDLETNDEISILARSFSQMITNLNQSRNDLLQAYDSALMGWSKALELRDKETEGHTQRVSELALALARELGIENEDLVNIRRGSILHDIGKMGVPDSILHKEGPLDESEWEIMRKHPVYAYQMLKDIRFLEPALDIPRYHHEYWNGKGYPYGLKGDEIPLAARVFSVVDVWDALTSERSYKKKFSATKSMAIIEEEAGTKLDPIVVGVFKRFMQKYLTDPGDHLE
jgi:putative nucleotidyltransferase with HDIG domain